MQLHNCPVEQSQQSPRRDCKTGNIGDSIHEILLRYGDGSSTFSAINEKLHLIAQLLEIQHKNGFKGEDYGEILKKFN